MKNWAQHAPMNFLHKFYLVEAERARVLGNDGMPENTMTKPSIWRKKHEYVNEEALANELAANFIWPEAKSRLPSIICTMLVMPTCAGERWRRSKT